MIHFTAALSRNVKDSQTLCHSKPYSQAGVQQESQMQNIFTFLFILSLFTQIVVGDVIFTSPTPGSLFPIGSQVTVTLSGLPSRSVTTVSQICDETVTETKIISALQPSAVFTLPADFFGICIYTALLLNPVPQPVPIFVGNTVSITSPVDGSTVLAGNDFPITLAYSPTTNPNLNFEVQLNCRLSSVGPYIQVIEGNATNQQLFNVPSNFEGQSCDLRVLNTVPGYFSVTVVLLQVLQIQQLTITNPQNGDDNQIGLPFNVLVTAPNPNTFDDIILTFTSDDSSTENVNAKVNVSQPLSLNSTFLGITTLTVSTAPIQFIHPAPVSFNLKYGLEITQAPKVIIGNFPFEMFIRTSADPVPPADQAIQVSLTCGRTLIQEWSVTLNQLVTLSAIPGDTPAQNNCQFSTPSNSIYYYQTSRYVVIFRSPFGGAVYPISLEEQIIFAESISFPPSDIILVSI